MQPREGAPTDPLAVIEGLATKLAGAALSDGESELLRHLLTPADEVEGFGYRAGPLARRDWLFLVAAALEHRPIPPGRATAAER